MAKLEVVVPELAAHAPWTARAPLPGGDFVPGRDDTIVAETRRRWPFVAEAHARRLVAAYGTRVGLVLAEASRDADLGPRFGLDLTGAELRYLMRHEWAETADDVLWRRSKLGLHASKDEHEAIEHVIAAAVGAQSSR